MTSVEHRALPDLREPDEGERTIEIQAPRKPRHLRHALPRAALEIRHGQAALTGFQELELPLIPAR
jgi:hypothetical protein